MHLKQFIYPFKDIWAISSFLLLQIKQPQKFTYKLFCGYLLSYILGKYLGVKCLHHMVKVHVTFWATTICFLKWLYYFILSPAEYVSSNCSTSSLILGVIYLFNFSHSGGREVVSCGFKLHFPDYWCWASLHILVCDFLWWNVSSNLSTFFLLALHWVSFAYSRYKSFVEYMYCICFLPVCGIFFIFLTVFFEE